MFSFQFHEGLKLERVCMVSFACTNWLRANSSNLSRYQRMQSKQSCWKQNTNILKINYVYILCLSKYFNVKLLQIPRKTIKLESSNFYCRILNCIVCTSWCLYIASVCQIERVQNHQNKSIFNLIIVFSICHWKYV